MCGTVLDFYIPGHKGKGNIFANENQTGHYSGFNEQKTNTIYLRYFLEPVNLSHS